MMQIKIVCSSTAHLAERPGLVVAAFAECHDLLGAAALALSPRMPAQSNVAYTT
jgi:hypothetical protein